MPDREVTFKQCNDFIPTVYNLKIHGCNGWDHNVTHIEARETMFQIANHLGYTCTHRIAKKPELTPQARQDIAATATLHSMGYRWSDTNQWQRPAADIGSAQDAVKLFDRYIATALSAVRAGNGTGTDSPTGADALKCMAAGLDLARPTGAWPALRLRYDANGLDAAARTLEGMGYTWNGGQQWRPPVVHKKPDFDLLDQWRERAEEAEAIAADRLTRISVLTNQAQAQDATLVRTKDALEVAQRDREALTGEILRIHEALAIEDPFSTDVTEIRRAIRDLQRQLEGRKQLAEVQQRANEAMTSHMLAITLALGLDYKPEGENILPAIEALQDKLGTKEDVEWACGDDLKRIGAALGIEDDAKASAHFIVPAIKALQTTCTERGATIDAAWAALAKNGYGTASLVPLPERITYALNHASMATSAASVTEATIEGMRGHIDAAFAALTDHGYTPDRGETLGTLIRDAFGAEAAKLRLAKASADGWQKAAAKLREESTDSNSAWHRGHVVGYTSGSAAERERCTGIAQSAADRLDSAIALRIAQEIKTPEAAQDSPATTAPESDNTQIKHDAYERAAKVADEWYQNHGTVLLLRVAQEIRALKR